MVAQGTRGKASSLWYRENWLSGSLVLPSVYKFPSEDLKHLHVDVHFKEVGEWKRLTFFVSCSFLKKTKNDFPKLITVEIHKMFHVLCHGAKNARQMALPKTSAGKRLRAKILNSFILGYHLSFWEQGGWIWTGQTRPRPVCAVR